MESDTGKLSTRQLDSNEAFQMIDGPPRIPGILSDRFGSDNVPADFRWTMLQFHDTARWFVPNGDWAIEFQTASSPGHSNENPDHGRRLRGDHWKLGSNQGRPFFNRGDGAVQGGRGFEFSIVSCSTR